MAKSKTVFRCQQCGFESPKWNGKCPSCGAWNSLVEETIQPAATKTPSSRKKADLSNFIQELQAVDTQEDIRYRTGIGELDRVLGGGLVKGSIVLLGGEPGIGKSTLLLQICEFFGASHSILYVSGEESTKQIKLRAERLHVTTESLYLLANNDAQSICDTIAACEPDIVIIDSIQNGIVIDHITAGKSMELYQILGLDQLDCTVAILKNVTSGKLGCKDIIKIDREMDLDWDLIGYVDPSITVNIIRDGKLVEKRTLKLPERIRGVLKCKNPRCITSVEQELPQEFVLTDREKRVYRCRYCETQAGK
mgnify:CR=1 FL=1